MNAESRAGGKAWFRNRAGFVDMASSVVLRVSHRESIWAAGVGTGTSLHEERSPAMAIAPLATAMASSISAAVVIRPREKRTAP